jgi:8-oxo-dGTP diphosphatase
VSDLDWDTWRPVDLATLLFVIRDDRVLLIRKKRGLGRGKINGPGGRLDPGESARQAAVREVQEELRITPTGVREVGLLLFQFVDGYSIHVSVFTADGFDGTPTETDEAIPMWFPVADIPYHEMWADDVIWLPEMLAGRAFFGRFIFDGDAMLDHCLELAAPSGRWPIRPETSRQRPQETQSS